MSAECADGRLVPLPIDREERWVIHAVLLNYVELASSAGLEADELTCELGVLEVLENGDSAFTVHELDRIRHEVAAHARALDSAERDRAVADGIVDSIDDKIARQPA